MILHDIMTDSDITLREGERNIYIYLYLESLEIVTEIS